MEIVKIGSNGTHDSSYKVARPNGYPYYLFLLIKTPAIFVINNTEIKAESSSAIIYDINYPHYYSPCNSTYINDWIHFKVEKGTDYFNALNLPLNTVFKVYDDTFICEMVRLMSNEYYSINANRNETMALLLQAMFSKLSEVMSTCNSKKHTTTHYTQLIGLRKEIYRNPQTQWRVDMLADKLNMCNTYLQKIYRETFGVSCVADVIASKINYAKELLCKTDMPISEVSRQCGYNNDVHFMRQFKKYIGVTPSEYRKNSSIKQ